MARFKDHFSSESERYARFRPDYPEALFDFLASLCRRRELAWDCGAGTGQAAVALAARFERVVATEAAAGQVARARSRPNIRYVTGRVEESGLPDRSVDLVTAASAVHWFDFDVYYAEVRRVLREEGVLAVWCYGLLSAGPDVDRVVRRLYADVLGAYWPPDRKHVESGYRSIPFPFPEVEPPALRMSAEWTFDHFVGYLHTWSSAQEYDKRHGEDAVEAARGELAAAWGEPSSVRTIRWPVHLRAGRMP